MFANTNSSHGKPSPKHSSAVYSSDLSFSWSDPDLDDMQDRGGSSPMVKSPWNNNWLLLELVATPKRRSTTGLVGRLVREEGHVYSLATKPGGFLYTGSDSKNIRVWKGLKAYAGFKSSSGLVKAIVIAGRREDLYGSSRWQDPGLQGLEKGPERTQMVRVFTDVQGLVQVVHQA